MEQPEHEPEPEHEEQVVIEASSEDGMEYELPSELTPHVGAVALAHWVQPAPEKDDEQKGAARRVDETGSTRSACCTQSRAEGSNVPLRKDWSDEDSASIETTLICTRRFSWVVAVSRRRRCPLSSAKWSPS